MKRATSRDGEFDCINSLDYPWSLPDDAVVIWTHSGRWPDADRVLRYLSKTQRDAMRGFALLTTNHRDAMRFPSLEEAAEALRGDNFKRPTPWGGLNVTTVAAMKLAHGFYIEEVK